MNELNKLHRKWVADLEHFTSVVKRSDVPKKTVDIFVDAFDPRPNALPRCKTAPLLGTDKKLILPFRGVGQK